eukprot:gene365-biopygen9023
MSGTLCCLQPTLFGLVEEKNQFPEKKSMDTYLPGGVGWGSGSAGAAGAESGTGATQSKITKNTSRRARCRECRRGSLEPPSAFGGTKFRDGTWDTKSEFGCDSLQIANSEGCMWEGCRAPRVACTASIWIGTGSFEN